MQQTFSGTKSTQDTFTEFIFSSSHDSAKIRVTETFDYRLKVEYIDDSTPDEL